KETLIDRKMDKDVAVRGLKFLKPPELTYTVVITFDNKVYKSVQDDAYMIQEMYTKANAIYKQTADSIKGKLAAFEKLAQGMADKGATEKQIEASLNDINKSIENDKKVAEAATEMAVNQIWKEYGSK